MDDKNPLFPFSLFCRHLGRIVERFADSALPPVRECDLRGHCTEIPAGFQREGGPLPVCSECELFNSDRSPEPERPVNSRCMHEGDILRMDTADLCGFRGQAVEVRSCDLHGECSRRRYCQRQVVRSCAMCPDFTGE